MNQNLKPKYEFLCIEIFKGDDEAFLENKKITNYAFVKSLNVK